MTVSQHPWLEDDNEYEGVGAHHSNPRYTPVDEDGYDDVTGEPINDWQPPEIWPPHTGEGPDVSNLGNERETEPDATP